MKKNLVAICDMCGNEDVKKDAEVAWDTATQQRALSNIYSKNECITCGSCGIEMVAMDSEEYKIIKLIRDTAEELLQEKPYTGGCRTFYTQEEWRTRLEQWGNDAVMVICHDGGDYAHFFNQDYESYSFYNKMDEALRAAGYWPEALTCWATAIYRSEDG